MRSPAWHSVCPPTPRPRSSPPNGAWVVVSSGGRSDGWRWGRRYAIGSRGAGPAGFWILAAPRVRACARGSEARGGGGGAGGGGGGAGGGGGPPLPPPAA